MVYISNPINLQAAKVLRPVRKCASLRPSRRRSLCLRITTSSAPKLHCRPATFYGSRQQGRPISQATFRLGYELMAQAACPRIGRVSAPISLTKDHLTRAFRSPATCAPFLSPPLSRSLSPVPSNWSCSAGAGRGPPQADRARHIEGPSLLLSIVV